MSEGSDEVLMRASKDKEAALEEAKGAANRLVMELHPDKGGDPEQFKVISELWQRLQQFELQPQPMRKSAMSVTEAKERIKGTPIVTFVGVAYSPEK